VVVRSPPLYPKGGPKWRNNYPEGLVAPELSGNIFSFSRHLTGRSWTVTLFFLHDRTLIFSPPFTRFLILFLLLASDDVHSNPGPAPVHLTNPKYPCSVCSNKVGQTSIQCSRCKRWVHSTCSGLPGPTLRSMFSRGDVGGCVCSPCSANHCTNCDVYLPQYDIDHCDTSTSHCDTSMASIPPEYCSLADSFPLRASRIVSPAPVL